MDLLIFNQSLNLWIFRLETLDLDFWLDNIGIKTAILFSAIFSDLNVDVNLHALVFGESVLNDAVAIVLVEALKDYEESVASCVATKTEDCVYGYWNILKAILDFVGIFAASFLVGSLMGIITALLTKFTHIRAHPLLESTLLVLMSYSTFLIAEVKEYFNFSRESDYIHKCPLVS